MKRWLGKLYLCIWTWFLVRKTYLLWRWRRYELYSKSTKSWRKWMKTAKKCLKQRNSLCLPRQEQEIKLGILLPAHFGKRGHLGLDSTIMRLKTSFWWSNLEGEAQEIFQSCLHCITSSTGKWISIPLLMALHGQRPNDGEYMELLYMSASATKEIHYVLVKKMT